MKFCRRLDLNRGSLVSETTALPTASQPLLESCTLLVPGPTPHTKCVADISPAPKLCLIDGQKDKNKHNFHRVSPSPFFLSFFSVQFYVSLVYCLKVNILLVFAFLLKLRPFFC